MGRDGGRDHDGGHAGQLPQQPAVEVVGTDPVRAGGHDLGAPGRSPRRTASTSWTLRRGPCATPRRRSRRSAPRCRTAPRCRPPGRAGRRAAPATTPCPQPLRGLGRRQRARPEQRAVEAEGVEADVAEKDVQPLPVGDRGLGRRRCSSGGATRAGTPVCTLPAPALLPRSADRARRRASGARPRGRPARRTGTSRSRGSRPRRRSPPWSGTPGRRRRSASSTRDPGSGVRQGDVLGRAPALRAGRGCRRPRRPRPGPRNWAHSLRPGRSRGQHQRGAQQRTHRASSGTAHPVSVSRPTRHRRTTPSSSLYAVVS